MATSNQIWIKSTSFEDGLIETLNSLSKKEMSCFAAAGLYYFFKNPKPKA